MNHSDLEAGPLTSLEPKQGLGHTTTVVSDTLDHAKFNRVADRSTKLQELHSRGVEVLPTFGGLMFDLFAAFLYPKPILRPIGAIRPSHRVNAAVVKQLLELPEYQEIHDSTMTDDLLSAMAVLEVSEAVLGILTKEDQERIKQMQQVEDETQDLQQAADQSQQDANQAGQKAKQAQGQAQQSGNSQDQASADQAQQRAQSAQQRAQNALHTLEQARQRLGDMASETALSINQPNRKAQLRQQVRAAVGDLNEQIQHEKDMLELWGFDPGQVKEMNYETISQLAKQLEANKKLLQITEILGALRPVWEGRKRKKEQVGVELIDKYYFSDDIVNAHPAELLEATIDELEDLFHLKVVEEMLFCVRTITQRKLGEGPGAFLRDRSGSMEGPKEVGATAVELALTNLLTNTGRATLHIWFTADSEPLEVIECLPHGSGGIQAKRYLVEWSGGDQKVIEGSVKEMTYFEAYVYIATQGRAGGGTDFDPPCRWMLEVLKNHPEFAKADGMILTDGHADLTGETVRQINALREDKKFDLLAVLINVGSSSEASVKRFARVKTFSQLTTDEAVELVRDF